MGPASHNGMAAGGRSERPPHRDRAVAVSPRAARPVAHGAARTLLLLVLLAIAFMRRGYAGWQAAAGLVGCGGPVNNHGRRKIASPSRTRLHCPSSPSVCLSTLDRRPRHRLRGSVKPSATRANGPAGTVPAMVLAGIRISTHPHGHAPRGGRALGLSSPSPPCVGPPGCRPCGNRSRPNPSRARADAPSACSRRAR